MVKVGLRGVVKVKAKGRTYWYAWRGGPRLHRRASDAEFMASYNEALASRRIPEPRRFRSLVTLYRGAATYRKLAHYQPAATGRDGSIASPNTLGI